MTRLPFKDLEQFYEALAQAIDTVAPAEESLFLTKLVMTLASRFADDGEALSCIGIALGTDLNNDKIGTKNV